MQLPSLRNVLLVMIMLMLWGYHGGATRDDTMMTWYGGFPHVYGGP
jgi:hypothetical protein